MNSGSLQHSWEGWAIVIAHSGKEWMQKDQEVTSPFSPRRIITSVRNQIWPHVSKCVCVCVQQLQGPTNLTREDCKDELISIYRELDLKDLASIKMSLLLSWALLQNMQKAQINTGRTWKATHMTFTHYALSSSHPSPIRFCSSSSHCLHTRSWLCIIKPSVVFIGNTTSEPNTNTRENKGKLLWRLQSIQISSNFLNK